nr:hypothetical protein [Tanacetum cinerariifolium]
AYTPAAIDIKSELEEAPLEIEELQPLVARTAPPSSYHNPTSSDPTPVSPPTDEEFEASDPSDTKITSSHSIIPCQSDRSDDPITFINPPELIKDTEGESSKSYSEREGSVNEGPDLEEEEEAILKGYVHEQQRVEETSTPRLPTRATWVDPRDGAIFTNIECIMPRVCAPIQTPPSLKWSSCSLPVSPSSSTVSTLVASQADSSPVASPATIEA